MGSRSFFGRCFWEVVSGWVGRRNHHCRQLVARRGDISFSVIERENPREAHTVQVRRKGVQKVVAEFVSYDFDAVDRWAHRFNYRRHLEGKILSLESRLARLREDLPRVQAELDELQDDLQAEIGPSPVLSMPPITRRAIAPVAAAVA